MRRLIIILVALVTATMGYSQSVIVVDSEKVFKSLESYNNALSQIDQMSKDYQSQVDAKFDEVEAYYNYYVAHKGEYSTVVRKSREDAILAMESAATAFQEEHFSKDGTIMKYRMELIAPIQEMVFSTIEEYATQVGADVVIDESSNPSLLYGSSKANHTQGVIDALKR